MTQRMPTTRRGELVRFERSSAYERQVCLPSNRHHIGRNIRRQRLRVNPAKLLVDNILREERAWILDKQRRHVPSSTGRYDSAPMILPSLSYFVIFC
jgi:hypothetical protein